jgi:hypothetical protein
MATLQEFTDFTQRIAALVHREGGRSGMRYNDVAALVRAEPELTVLTAHAFVAGDEPVPGLVQLAALLGQAYERAHGDDSLLLFVEEEVRERGIDVRPLEMWLPPDEAPDPSKGVVVLQVDPGEMERGDPYAYVRIFSLQGRSDDEIRSFRHMRGAFALGFPLEHDPREVWEVPEARAFVRTLLERVPHLPYFLHADPDLGMLRVVFSCAADPEAFLEDGGIDLLHPSVLVAVLRSFVAVVELCRRLGDDPAQVVRAALQGAPSEFADLVLRALGLTEG